MDNLETIESLFDKIKEQIRKDTINEISMNSINIKVRTQHTRIYKFLCWLMYGHLIENGVCLRCGKKFININKII